MRLTKFLGRKCKVCIRILLLKSFLLGTNCPSFLPILCGILFVSAVDLFCFCRGCLCVYSFLLFVFLFSPLFLQFSPTKSEKRGSFFGKSPSFFWKSPSFFGKSPSFFGGYSLTPNFECLLSMPPEPLVASIRGSVTPSIKGSATL